MAEVINKEKDEVQDLLFTLARTFDEKKSHIRRINKASLPDDIFDDSLMHIEDTIKYSTMLAFNQSEFYRELPPRLRSNLVFEVLRKQILSLKFFFNDYIRGFSAP